MNKLIISLILISFSCHFSFSQSSFTPGYIVNHEGDTTYGLIKKQSGRIRSEYVIFKKSDEEKNTKYTVREVKSYAINCSELYIAENISYRRINKVAGKILDESKTNLDENKAIIIKSTVFLSVLVSGHASLYLYIDEDSDEHYFIRKENEQLYELYQLKKYAIWSYATLARDGYRIDKNYLGILQMLLYDCPDIIKKLERVELNTRDLTNITLAYNECMMPADNKSVSYKSSGGIKLEKSVFFGLNLSTYHFSGGSFPYLTEPNHPISRNINFGFNFNVSNPYFTKRFSLSSGLHYFQINYDYRFIEELGITTRNTYDVHLETHYLKIPILINYNFTSAKLTPYVFLGMHNNIVLKSNNSMTTYKETVSGSTTSYKPPIAPHWSDSESLRTYELLGLSTGAGMKHLKEKKFGYYFEVKYERIQALCSISNVSSSSESLFFSFGLIF